MKIFSRLTPRFYLGQWAGNFVLMLLAAVWLQIPDSHSWQFVVSMLSAVLLVIGFLWLYTATFRYLRPCTPRAPWWQAWLTLAVCIALWLLMQQLIADGRAHESLYAGYANSQSPTWIRRHLGYSALVAWQERIYDGVQWLWGGLLVPAAVVVCACRFGKESLRQIARVYAHWLYWIAVLAAALAAEWLTWALADWTPSFGLAGQTVSAVLRLGLAYSADILLWCFVLALIAHYLDGEARNQV
jgi:Co/Zn/Cd efflux system component